jgi:cytochrome c5
MSKTIRFQVTLAAVILLASAVGFAQSGDATYKAKCQMCHGAAGQGNAAMKVKPATDPSVKAMNQAAMVAAVKNGMGKMQPFAGKLPDAQISAAVDYFRTFVK